MSDSRTLNVGLLQQMLEKSPGDADVFATTSALVHERLFVIGVAHCELASGERVLVLLCRRDEVVGSDAKDSDAKDDSGPSGGGRSGS